MDHVIERILQVLGLRLTSRHSSQLNVFLGRPEIHNNDRYVDTRPCQERH